MNSSVKSAIFMRGILAAIALTALVVYAPTAYLDTSDTSPFDLHGVPMYPDATDVAQEQTANPLAEETVTFNSEGIFAYLEKYYLAELPKRGWKLQNDWANGGYLEFYIGQSPQPLGYNLDLQIEMVSGSSNIDRRFQMSYHRVPVPSQVPVFPNSQQISIHGEPIGPGFQPDHRAFTTQASPSDVFNFYERELPKYGWELDRNSDRAHGYLVYEYCNTPPTFCNLVAHATIAPVRQSGGTTRIDLYAGGSTAWPPNFAVPSEATPTP